ncbi:MAG TPA: choice-of-anchor tandem repeat GloVer-containing protein, partial [Methylomirabilota bacterium]|nr:choice-of-anchor tandem repeat GloVer-containing protein [Methylomirabilota bacterium]
KDGNFYGTTLFGGAVNFGTVFRFSTNGTLASIVAFGGTNGANPQCQLVTDAAGNFYGTAFVQGGLLDGIVFRVTTNGVLTTLATLKDTEDGLTPGTDGNFYGTTPSGGSNNSGAVFRVTPGGVLTTLVSFNDTNGAFPVGGLVQANDGTLYGTTSFGGANLDFGTIFKVTTNGVLTDLFHFHFTDGARPASKLIFGPDGNLYGTASAGGSLGNNPFSSGLGAVFRITTNGAFTPLVLFQGTNGANPQASLVLGPDGNLYGTTVNGGPGGGGTIFRIVLAPQFTSITRLPGGSVLLAGAGLSGDNFHLLASTNIFTPLASWTSLTNGSFDDSGQFSFTDPGAAIANTRFYRISVP